MDTTAKKIITIDDERAVRRSLKAFLEDSGFDVLEAENGREGIRLIQEESPDLVLCDLRMPEVDGLEVVKYVSENLPDLPIIIVSGTGVIGDAVEAVRLGAWDYVLKPVEDMEALEQIILRALDRAGLIQENRLYKQHLVDEVNRQTAEIRSQAEQLSRINDALRGEIRERERAERVLAENERQYRELVSNLQEGLGSVDANEVFTYCNPAMAHIFELEPNELIGRTLVEFLPPHEQARVVEQTHERVQGRIGTYNLEITTALGNARLIVVHARPEFSSAGQYIGATALVQDITEQKKLENHLRHTQKMETIGTLAGGIAHDFNNILTPILGFAEMAKTDWEDKVSRRESVDQIITAALRARDLVKQILVFSRQSESTKEATEIHLIVREVAKLLYSTLPADIEIIEVVDRNSGLALADATQIHQLVMNLCTNAYHAMEGKGGELELGLARFDVDVEMAQRMPALRPGPYLRLTVSDTGCGMTKELQEKIFEPFFTTKEVGKGTGLGLALVHGNAAEHSGHVTVYSEPGVGTTFNVYLPRIAETEPRRDTTNSTVQGGNESIMVVDDERQIATMAEKILERLGYKVSVFTDSVEALNALRADTSSFDVLITDLNMPKLSGTKLIEQARQLNPNIPVIVISGFSERITEENCQAYGISRFITKPIVTLELDAAIRDALKDVPVASHKNP